MKSPKLSFVVGVGKGSLASWRGLAQAMGPAILLLATMGAWAQTPPDLEQGLKAFGSYHGGSLDNVSLTNGNLFFHADLFSYSQRGGELAYPIVLRYNNKVFSLFSQPCPPATPDCVPTETILFGPNPLRSQKISLGNSVTVGYEALPAQGTGFVDTGVSFDGTEIFIRPASVLMPDGSTHQLVTTNSGLMTIDGSGYAVSGNGPLTGRDGTSYASLGTLAQDRNGNLLSFDGTATWTDTLGRAIPAAPTVPLPPGTPNPSNVSLTACPALNYSFQAVTYAYTWNLPTVNGGTLPLVLCYTSVWVRTNFVTTGSSSGPHFFDVNQAFPMLQSVVFPDKTYWAFQYDAADPNNTSSIAFGDLLKVTLPSGGSITYTWQNWQGCVSQFTPPGGSFSRAVQTRSVDAADGVGPHLWHYSYSLTSTATSLAGQTVVNDAANNDTVHVITGLGATCSLYETQTQYYQGLQGGSQLLKTVTTDYQYTVNPYDPVAISNNGGNSVADSVTNVFPIRRTTTLPNGQVSKVETDYDNAVAYHGPVDGITSNVNECPSSGGGGSGHTITDPPSNNPPTGGGCWGDQTTNPVTNYTGSYGKVVAKREYDWGQGAPGALLRQTKTTYQWQVNSSYLTANLLDLPASVQVLDGNGNQVALTTYGYDEYGLNSSGVTTQFTTSPPNGSTRGNLTSTHHWLSGSTIATANCPIAVTNGFIVTYATYNDTGTTNQETDTCGSHAGDAKHTTTFAYSPSFAGAYPTSVTNPLGQTASTNYDSNTGLVTSLTDVNNQITSTDYDPKWRAIHVNRPDGGQTTFCYTDAGGSTCNQSSPPFAVVITRKIDANRNLVSTAVVDGLGRKTKTQVNSTPVCTLEIDFAYDAMGRAATATNPFCTTSDPTYGVTSTGYDAMGRVIQVTHPDNTFTATSYTGRAVAASDEGNGSHPVQRISQSDGLGRLQSVCEVTSAALSVGSGAAPGACNLDIPATGFLTSYGYDTLGNLTSVSQGGYMPRSFFYDSLSHLVTASNPESGTMVYGYDAAGNVITRTDARGIVTTYSYDVLHRLFQKSYSDGTPTTTFTYDNCPSGGCPGGVNPQLTVGRLVESAVPGAQTFYSYDQLGRTVNQWQCAPVSCGTTNPYSALVYGYDLNGDLTSFNNGFGTTLSNAYDTAARLTGVASNLSDAAHPANLLSNIQYNGAGLEISETAGNNVTEARGYDTRLRLTSLAASSPTAIGATPATATVTINGAEASRQVAATTATGSVAISGTDRQITKQSCHLFNGQDVCVQVQVLDSGTVSITVGSNPAVSYSYGQNGVADTPYTVAYGLAGFLNSAGAVKASVNGDANGLTTCAICTISFITNASGTASNYALSASASSSVTGGASTSFSISASGANLVGGADAYTVYDAGTVSVTVNNIPTSVPYGNGSSNNSIASALAGSLTNGTLVNATANGNVISITSKNTGTASNYPLSVGSSSTAGFSPVSFSAGTPGGTLTGGAGATSGPVYIVSLGYAPNSNVLTANDSANGNWSYGYDDFNRLTSSNKNSGQQTYGYLYDRFGNRWQQNAPLGGHQFLASFTGGNNRLDNVSHDASGNVTQDPTTGASYTFDAEGRVTQVNGGAVVYTYDADGQRVEKNVGGVKTDYVYDASGHAVAEISASGTVTRQELFAGGRHLGTYTNSTTYFSHGDWLGTERVRSDMTGAACETIQSLPFGDGQTTSGACGDPSMRHFTGKERDAETGLDYFGARYYGSGIGQFIAPDWAGHPTAVPYADFGNPQSLNLYSYVKNNPVTRNDPDGHCDVCMQLLIQWFTGRAMADGGVKPAAKNVGVGAAKGAGSWGLKTLKVLVLPPVLIPKALKQPEPQALRPSNETQRQVKGATETTLTVATAVLPGLQELSVTKSASGVAETTALSTMRLTAEGETFTHYGYIADADKFAGGLRAGGFATTESGLTGAEAQSGLALPHATVPDAAYTVTPTTGTMVIENPTTAPAFGQPGGLPETQFPLGTAPGTVSAPKPIPSN